MFRRLGHAEALPVALKSSNDSTQYAGPIIDKLLDALLETGGHWIRFYTPGDCAQVAERIRHNR